MVVRLRLARFGKRHAPVYNIVVQHARTARDSKPIEVIGTYDPIPKPAPAGGKPIKDIQLDTLRAKYWLGVGAQPSDPVWRLLAMFKLIEPQWDVARIAARNEALAKAAEKGHPPKSKKDLRQPVQGTRRAADAQRREGGSQSSTVAAKGA